MDSMDVRELQLDWLVNFGEKLAKSPLLTNAGRTKSGE